MEDTSTLKGQSHESFILRFWDQKEKCDGWPFNTKGTCLGFCQKYCLGIEP